jgi:DNA-binding response OmpR family regulator
MARVAVLDDDEEFREFLEKLLERGGHQSASYASAGRFLDDVYKKKLDLLIVDARLPGMDGREVVRVLRRNPETRGLPIIMVSGVEKEPAHVVQGLNDGADEYLTKPISGDSLLARLASLLRRVGSNGGMERAEVWSVGPLTLRPDERIATLDGDSIELTRLEFDVLVFFIRHPNRVLTRQMLLQEVWQQPPGLATRTVDKHIENVRKKLGKLGERIETVINVGYAFRPGRK